LPPAGNTGGTYQTITRSQAEASNGYFWDGLPEPAPNQTEAGSTYYPPDSPAIRDALNYCYAATGKPNLWRYSDGTAGFDAGVCDTYLQWGGNSIRYFGVTDSCFGAQMKLWTDEIAQPSPPSWIDAETGYRWSSAFGWWACPTVAYGADALDVPYCEAMQTVYDTHHNIELVEAHNLIDSYYVGGKTGCPVNHDDPSAHAYRTLRTGRCGLAQDAMSFYWNIADWPDKPYFGHIDSHTGATKLLSPTLGC